MEFSIITDLLDDLLIQVFSFLDNYSWANIRKCCKRYHRITYRFTNVRKQNFLQKLSQDWQTFYNFSSANDDEYYRYDIYLHIPKFLVMFISSAGKIENNISDTFLQIKCLDDLTSIFRNNLLQTQNGFKEIHTSFNISLGYRTEEEVKKINSENTDFCFYSHCFPLEALPDSPIKFVVETGIENHYFIIIITRDHKNIMNLNFNVGTIEPITTLQYKRKIMKNTNNFFSERWNPDNKELPAFSYLSYLSYPTFVKKFLGLRL